MSTANTSEIDVERTYDLPPQQEQDEESGCGLCCCSGRDDKEDDKDAIRGLIGTRWSTFLMILLWLAGIVLSSINLGWTKVINVEENIVVHL